MRGVVPISAQKRQLFTQVHTSRPPSIHGQGRERRGLVIPPPPEAPRWESWSRGGCHRRITIPGGCLIRGAPPVARQAHGDGAHKRQCLIVRNTSNRRDHEQRNLAKSLPPKTKPPAVIPPLLKLFRTNRSLLVTGIMIGLPPAD